MREVNDPNNIGCVPDHAKITEILLVRLAVFHVDGGATIDNVTTIRMNRTSSQSSPPAQRVHVERARPHVDHL